MWGRVWGKVCLCSKNRIDIKGIFFRFDSSPATNPELLTKNQRPTSRSEGTLGGVGAPCHHQPSNEAIETARNSLAAPSRALPLSLVRF